MIDRGRSTHTAAALGSWVRFAVIIGVIVLNAVVEEARIVRAEFMMLVRWTRDVLRYDLRWMVEEKMRLTRRRRPRSVKD